MGDAISIEQRLHDLFAIRRHRHRPEHSDRESPREMERRTVERLYGGHPSVLVHVEHQEGEEGG
jgi:hypothetical protein